MSNYRDGILILSVTGFSSGTRPAALRAAGEQRVARSWRPEWGIRTVAPSHLREESPMILGIVAHTPVWVWIVFAGLVLLGLQQTRTRDVGIARATILPVVMIVLSLSGVLTAFAHVPLAWGAWAVGVVLAFLLAGNAVAVHGASRSAQPGHLRIPGSVVPVVLIIAIFTTKYAAG